VVCRSVTLVSPTETAEAIEMPFALKNRVSPRNHVLDIAKRFEPNTVLWAFNTIQPFSCFCSHSQLADDEQHSFDDYIRTIYINNFFLN